MVVVAAAARTAPALDVVLVSDELVALVGLVRLPVLVRLGGSVDKVAEPSIALPSSAEPDARDDRVRRHTFRSHAVRRVVLLQVGEGGCGCGRRRERGEVSLARGRGRGTPRHGSLSDRNGWEEGFRDGMR